MNKYVLVCHCLLDPLTRTQGTKRISRDITTVLIDSDVSIIQLPCPELKYGFSRPPCNKEDYDTPEYRDHCRDLARDVYTLLERYHDFNVVGLISIGGSPSCGAQRTHRQGRHVREPGIFIEELQTILQEKGLTLNIVDHDLLEDTAALTQFLSGHPEGPHKYR
jgi:predicted secreted protein